MPWSLDWSVVIICLLLAVYQVWLWRTVIRLERSVRLLDEMITLMRFSLPSAESENLRDACGSIVNPKGRGEA